MAAHPDLGAAGLRAALAGAREIYVSGCSAEITALPALLDAADIGGTVTGIISPILNRQSYAASALGRRCRTFFLNAELRAQLAAGAVDFCPWSYSEMTRWFRSAAAFDATIVMVSLPDAGGCYSLGTQQDFLPDFMDRAGAVIGVVNPALPRTTGTRLPRDRFTALFSIDQPLLELASDGTVDPVSTAIADRVAALVPDGATLQIGIGRIPQAVAIALSQHRGLRIHSGLIDENILHLEAAGALDRDAPVVAGVAIGTRTLYDHLDGNERFRFASASHTHAFATIAAIPSFCAINGGLEVDLFGQVNSEAGAGRLIASPGGLSDFMRGARQSAGGMAIVALRAKPGRLGRGGIVPQIDAPSLVSLPRCDLDVVVTENGVADLRGASFDQRAEALIAIADPGRQSALSEQWQALRSRALT